MFFCIPIVFGCPVNTKAEGGGEATTTRLLCPKCHNLSVVRAKRTQWFELFWIPLIPLQWKHIWACTICGWWQKVQKGEENTVAGRENAVNKALAANAANPEVYTPPRRPGYQPAYISASSPGPTQPAETKTG